MENYIVIIAIISSIILFLSAVIVFVRFYRERTQFKILLGVALIVLLAGSIINVFEHTAILQSAEEFEQILSILFLPIIIFAIYESIIGEQLRTHIKSEQMFKGIFNQTFSFVGLLNSEGRILEANSTACDFIGYDNDEYKGVFFPETRWWKHSAEEMKNLEGAIKQAGQGKTVRYETTNIDKDGKIHYVDFSLKPIHDSRDRLIYLIAEGRDITEIKSTRLELEKHKKNLEDIVEKRTLELKTANEELQLKNETLYEKNTIINEQNAKLVSTLIDLKETQTQLLQAEKMASLGVLTAGVAHEINNPLNYIVGAYEALKQKDTHSGDEEAEMLLDAIKTGVDRVAGIVKSLNQFSRDTPAENEECNIHEIIDDSLVMLHSRLNNKIEIHKNYFKDSFVTFGNVGNFHQVFLNILSNAEQAINEKGKIWIKTTKNDNYLIITITDSGKGIEKDAINKITDPFYTTKDPGEGIGLGLSIVFGIIKEHGGRLEFESEVNKGTTVTVMLPQKGMKHE
ncbi:ATP-binding protein [uncultured Draconibacterium sp.]|uniref:PAS domain-containing sensor histidine kinase n=1 Tax=uncultured Draconibacterium sp. TaxID=1573823 RepID=UPI0029C7903A|nr:ATP-binding protein [uncultured Draconibacterium sp.]